MAAVLGGEGGIITGEELTQREWNPQIVMDLSAWFPDVLRIGGR